MMITYDYSDDDDDEEDDDDEDDGDDMMMIYAAFIGVFQGGKVSQLKALKWRPNVKLYRLELCLFTLLLHNYVSDNHLCNYTKTMLYTIFTRV